MSDPIKELMKHMKCQGDYDVDNHSNNTRALIVALFRTLSHDDKKKVIGYLADEAEDPLQEMVEPVIKVVREYLEGEGYCSNTHWFLSPSLEWIRGEEE